MNATSRLLRVTSQDLSSASTGTDTDMEFRTNDRDLHQVHRIMLKTVCFPNAHYNINRYNNEFFLGGNDIAEVPPIEIGQYNLSQFMTALKEALDSASTPWTWTIVQDPITRRLIFTKSGGDEFFIYGKVDGNKMWRESGSKVTVQSVGLTAITSGIPDLSGLRHVYVESLSVGAQILTGNVNKYSILADFPISVPFGSYQTIEYDDHTNNQITYRGSKQLSSFDLRFTDDQNRELSLGGLDWVLVFVIHSVGA
jgi:hypothetical protein